MTTSPNESIREYTAIVTEIETHTKALNALRKRKDVLAGNIFDIMTQNGNANYTIKTKSGNFAFKSVSVFSGFNKEYFKSVFTKCFNGDAAKVDTVVNALYANRTKNTKNVLTRVD